MMKKFTSILVSVFVIVIIYSIFTLRNNEIVNSISSFVMPENIDSYLEEMDNPELDHFLSDRSYAKMLRYTYAEDGNKYSYYTVFLPEMADEPVYEYKIPAGFGVVTAEMGLQPAAEGESSGNCVLTVGLAGPTYVELMIYMNGTEVYCPVSTVDFNPTFFEVSPEQ